MNIAQYLGIEGWRAYAEQLGLKVIGGVGEPRIVIFHDTEPRRGMLTVIVRHWHTQSGDERVPVSIWGAGHQADGIGNWLERTPEEAARMVLLMAGHRDPGK